MVLSKTLKNRIYDHVTKARAFEVLSAAVVCANSAPALQSAREAEELGILTPLLVGPAEAIRTTAETISWVPRSDQIIDAENEAEAAKIATNLAATHQVQALIKGNIHTNTLISAVLDRSANLRTNNRLTHAFYMFMPDETNDLIITDAAINVAPDIKTSLATVANALKLGQACKLEPKIAVLSCTDDLSESIPSSLHANRVVEACLKQNLCLSSQIFGPLALDQAISTEAANIKGFTHPIAGQANILVVPNIETGNALFKALVHFGGAVAAGIVLGAKVPVVLTSRADPAIARLASICLAHFMASENQT